MRRLFLVRHATPQPTPGLSAHGWPLAPQGAAQAREPACSLQGEDIARVVTSREPKARETGRIIAGVLGLPVEAAPGLHEQARETARYFQRSADFRAALAEFFRHPAERVFGEESADEAHGRFSAAVAEVMAHKDGDVVVVAHGTVNSLLVARANGLDAVDFWQSLALPDLVTLAWPDLRLLARGTP